MQDRRSSVVAANENLLVKANLDLPPNLRALDNRIEQVELGLRAAIVAALEDDASQIPENLLPRVSEKIERAIKKSPSLQEVDLAPLLRKLEYFDLRELQDLITNKTHWEKFSNLFTGKEALIAKFNQLAELRNCIRHNRSVDDITRMEGEAAVNWFESCLQRAIT